MWDDASRIFLVFYIQFGPSDTPAPCGIAVAVLASLSLAKQ